MFVVDLWQSTEDASLSGEATLGVVNDGEVTVTDETMLSQLILQEMYFALQAEKVAACRFFELQFPRGSGRAL